MTATAHAVVGAAIAAGTGNPAVSLPMAFVSHFLMDLIPHWDFGTNFRNRPKILSIIFAAADVIFGFTLVFVVFGQTVNPVLLWSSVIAAQLPDWIEAPNLFFGAKFAPSAAIDKIQHKLHNRLGLPWGIVTQLFLILPLITSTPPSVFAK